MRRMLAIMCCVGLGAPAGALASGGPATPEQGGAGVSTPGSPVSYVAVGVGQRTLVERVRRDSGAVERVRVLEGRYGVARVADDGSATGLSADRRTLVLAQVQDRFPRVSRLVVLDARRLAVREHITLRGSFAVDAISSAARWLYLIRYTSTRDALRYEVRAYDMGARRLIAKPVVDPREPDEAMRGVPVTRATSADGRWAYTLYQRPEGAPFVHALDTDHRTAACIDLPALSGADFSGVRLALDRGGDTLAVVSPSGPQALVDTRTFSVRRPGVTPSRPRAARPGAGGDGDAGGAPWELIAAAATALAAGVLLARRRRHARSATA